MTPRFPAAAAGASFFKRTAGGLAKALLRRTGPCPAAPRRVLVVAVGFIGDIVIIQPFLRSLRLSMPSARVSLMLEKGCLPLLRGNAFVDGVIPYDKARARDIPYLLSLIAKARRERFDVAVVHYGHFHVEDILFFMGIRHTIGYNHDLGFKRRLTYELFSRTVFKDWGINEIDNSFALLRAIGVQSSPGEAYPPVPVSPGSVPPAAAAFAAGERGARPPLVLMHIGAGYPTKKWPPARWAAAGDLLRESMPVSLFITGTRDDIREQEEILGQMRRPAAGLCGATTLEGLIALIDRADLLLTTDSGPKHIAYSLGVPTVEVYGSSEQWRWGAYWDREIHIALDKKPNPAIDPSLAGDGRYHPVIQQVTAEEAAAAALSLLRRKGAR